MATLHIEHRIKDFATWKAAFDRFADQRAAAGVTSHRIHQPIDDERYVVVQLDFATAERARGFLQFLQERVWSVPASSPGLDGSPTARLLVPAPSLP